MFMAYAYVTLYAHNSTSFIQKKISKKTKYTRCSVDQELEETPTHRYWRSKGAGTDGRFPLTDEVDHEFLAKLAELTTKKRLLDYLLDTNVSTRDKILRLEEKQSPNPDITAGRLYQDWDYIF